MMTFLLEGKEKLKILYGRYGTYISPILKFILALFIFSSINRQLGYLAALNNIFVVLILALICSIIPLNGIAVFGGLLIIGHCFGLSLVAGIVAVILFLVIEILYLRFVQGDSLALVLMPVASSLGIPCAVPIGFGLRKLRRCGLLFSGCCKGKCRSAPELGQRGGHGEFSAASERVCE